MGKKSTSASFFSRDAAGVFPCYLETIVLLEILLECLTVKIPVKGKNIFC